MNIVILASYAKSLVNFRGDLIKDMIAAGHRVTAIAPENDCIDDIRSLGANFIQVQFNRTGVNPFKDINFIRKLKKVLISINPDIFLGYTIKPVVYGSIAAKMAGIENRYSMITGLGSNFIGTGLKSSLFKTISKILYKKALNKCHKVIFQNEDDMNDFVRMGIVDKANCYIVNGSGVNMEYFCKKPLPGKPIFLMIARLLRDKGVFEYLKAAEIIKKKHPQVDLHLVGSFDSNPTSLKEEDLREYIDNDIVIFNGSTNDVRPYMEMCSIYVLPSYREGTPRTVLEAMAMGRPVITSDAPGCRQTVIDNKTGFLVPPGDSKTLSEKMLWMINNPIARNRMGEAGYAYCIEKYNVDIINGEMLRILGIS